ncbi:uncharacterized protein F5891DRAFT_1277565 [Suillus fuscotomentosus]|uniref:Protein kinase domain-containing protein n=1 Tax=Suillus fuscotomentosus TaxID=1912939 RepID=A0AAD4E9F6_9AGAM|nr:uncharacterized protein F5891DRAFT_1277565 [Suillus fuscotomentosus]KAG1901817.1 hypothetical protein F5891DRAFT_1277565 [Suillus fuscotomentosus]
MADNADATVRDKTPPRNSALSADSETGLKSTPLAVGSAIVSEHISTVGLKVKNVSPWIARDVQNFEKCEADAMLQELLARCTGRSQNLSVNEKSKLLETALNAVLPICNAGAVAQEIKGHLTNFCDTNLEPLTYAPFVKAANCALRELSKVNVQGIPAFKVDEKTNVLLHVSDTMPIYQDHQDKQSERKPDVVVVSHQTALGTKAHETQETQVLTETACKSPKDNFQWTDVRSTLELKRPRKFLTHPPSVYKTDYIVPSPSAQYMECRKDTSGPAKPTGSTPATGSAQTPHEASNELRPSSQLSRGVKRKRGGNNEDRTEEDDPAKPPPIVQNGLYVAEMFAAHIARQHVISFIVNNDYIYIWFCDRETTIQGAAINFVQDLPRWLVLLLIMQRMGYEQWGLNRVFEPEPGFSGKVMVEDAQIDLELDVKSKERVTHFGIRGRATTVFPVKSEALSDRQRDACFLNESPELVAKLYWPEETRQSEPDILKEVYKIAQTDLDVRGHVPELVWFHKFEETSTSKIRVALGLKDAERAEQGSRVLYIIVFRKLIPITTLSGEEFIAAWWQVVKCHRALWKRGVLHRDVSPSNLMVYRLRGQFIGVLNDYDLSSFKRDGPRGLERTGTLPFMAADLLTPDAMAGKVEHVYAHDAESLIWVLTWVCLRYEGGNLLSKNRPLEEWLKVDASLCQARKAQFWSIEIRNVCPSTSHAESWDLVKNCLWAVQSLYTPFEYRKLTDELAFQLLLEGPMLEHDSHKRT